MRFGILIFLSACAGELEDKEAFLAVQKGCPDIPQLFAERCVSGCHSAKDKAAALDLESPDMAARVVGQQGSCGPLADPSNPKGSLLYTKLGDKPACGARMPRLGEPFTSHEMSCVEQWIGAQKQQ